MCVCTCTRTAHTLSQGLRWSRHVVGTGGSVSEPQAGVDMAPVTCRHLVPRSCPLSIALLTLGAIVALREGCVWPRARLRDTFPPLPPSLGVPSSCFAL